jgi:Na+-driven multidrug efflux pump
MLIGVPCAVSFKLKFRSKREDQKEYDTAQEGLMGTKEPVDTGLYNIVLSSHKETRKILRLAIPYTFSAVASTTFSNVCLVFVSKAIGTRAVAAYALVQILVGLFDGVLQGPIAACTTLCAQAVGGGVGNAFLAGQYIQLAVLFYFLLYIPAVYFWWVYMYDVILYLE